MRVTFFEQLELELPSAVSFDPPEPVVPLQLHDLPAGVLALDTETSDPGISRGVGSSWPLGEGFVCGVSIVGPGVSLYASFRHAAGNNVDEALFWRWLRVQAAREDITFVMANSPYDIGWTTRHGVVFLNNPVDVQAMAYVLDEHRRSYSLANLGQDFLGEDKSSAQLVAAARKYNVAYPMSNMQHLPAWVVAPYCVQDAALTRRLYDHFLPLLEKDDLLDVLAIESASAQVAVDMRRLGVRVDLAKVERLRGRYVELREIALKQIADTTGVHMQPFENAAAAKALRIENPDIQLPSTSRGNDSVRRDVLHGLRSPIAIAIGHARKYDKAIGTFLDGYIEKFVVGDRIHAEFHPTRRPRSGADDSNDALRGTTSNRWSSSNPNLQNIPIRDPDIGPDIRSCFIADEGTRWCKLDWASQEPRFTVHYAALVHMTGAAAMVSRFQADPMTDLHGETAALMNVPRQNAKTINLAIAYGAGSANIAQQLGLRTKHITTRDGRLVEVAGEEAQALIDLHARSMPFLSGLQAMVKSVAESRGFIKLFTGRRMHFKRGYAGKYERTHKALNALIQGSAAEQMKIALVELRHAGIPVNLTVHDEADLMLPAGAEGDKRLAQAKQIMESCVKLQVPVVAEHKIGADWGLSTE